MTSDSLPATTAETHISWVLLTGDRAYKIHKPIATDVLDRSTVERRHAACEQEVRLNRRLAPDVYRGVATIRLDDEDLEPVIVMRRMPAERRLAALLESSEARDLVREVARTVAAFHSGEVALSSEDARRVASADALSRRWAEDLEGLREVGGPGIAERVTEVEDLVVPYLEGRGRLFDDRIESGMVRDGHGDLLADDIFCLEDGPRILDCLAFSDDLRRGDVLADVAFLVMDLQRLGHPELGRTFLRDYCEFSGEHHPGSLAHLHVAQRALVRAKVTALRDHQNDQARDDQAHDGGRKDQVGALLDLVVDHLQRARIRLVLVGGLPGSGKSTFAQQLADDFGWTVLSSDEIRRDLGLRYEDLQDEVAYTPETVAKVYDAMRHRAEHLLGRGMSVVLDATWTSAKERAAARALADDNAATILEIRCEAPLATLRQRVRSREASTSEATAGVVDVLAARQDAWPEALTLSTEQGDSDAVWAFFAAQASATWWRPTSSSAARRSR